MEYLKTQLIKALITHFGDDDPRIEHALRVTAWAEKILEHEPGDYDIVLAVGLLHDVGIKEAEARDGSASGKLQEKYGPAIARPILKSIGFTDQQIEESCAIIGNHHTPEGTPSRNFPILWDADMLVNIRDEMANAGHQKLSAVIEKSFKTATGRILAQNDLLRQG
ncbi:MAG: HD domain-containing protein [Armatimonadota bacterium]